MARNAVVGALFASTLLAALVGCGGDTTSPPLPVSALRGGRDSLATLVRQLTAGRGITQLGRPPRVRPALVRLGRVLAFDKILSGNHDIACMTCHLPAFATGDARSLSIGQGATGLGPSRTHPQGSFIPRNAPSLFNLSAPQPLFWDGRVQRDEQGSYHTPAGAHLTSDMTRVFEFGTLSAQPLFPVLSRSEMRGDGGNELAAIDDANEPAVWRGLMARLGEIRRYRQLFEAAYPGQRFEEMTFAHASNAMAGFFVARLSFNDSPWDRFLAGDDRALSPVQMQGAKNFMSARCSVCHNGPALTDNTLHNVALAQVGPGKGDGAGGQDDFGRMRVTGSPADRYAFPTSPLRNVELRNCDVNQLEAALRSTRQATTNDILATRDPLLLGVVFTPQTIDEVAEFMKALTDPAARQLRRIAPRQVPSGLPVDGDSEGMGDDDDR